MRRIIPLVIAAAAFASLPVKAEAVEETCFGQKPDLIITEDGRRIGKLVGYGSGTNVVLVYQDRAQLFFNIDGNSPFNAVCVKKADHVRISGRVTKVHTTGQDTRVDLIQRCSKAEATRFFNVYQVDTRPCFKG